MIGIGKRVTALEARLPGGCAMCRSWCAVVLGDDAGSRSWPERCPVCGRLVPIELVTVIVGVPLEAV